MDWLLSLLGLSIVGLLGLIAYSAWIAIRRRRSATAATTAAILFCAFVAITILASGLFLYQARTAAPASDWGTRQTEWDSLGLGRFVYNPPDEMVLGQGEPITVRIYRGAPPSPADGHLVGRGRPRSEQLKVGPRMAVAMSGDGFHIQSTSPKTQFVPKDSFSEWIFHVEPKQEGDQVLVLQASIVLGLSAETELPAISRNIHVKVRPGQRIIEFLEHIDFWKWLLGVVGTAVIGVGGYLSKNWWERRSRKKRC
jgi:hypothetical protein